MSAISDLLPDCGDPAKVKVVFADQESFDSETASVFRSLNIEHVSPSLLMQTEISRSTSLGAAAQRDTRQGRTWSEATVLAVMRKWFWARKPDAGFLLTGFPATLLQAKVFDEWVETRGELLHGVFHAPSSHSVEIVAHYRNHGLALEAFPSSSLR